LPAHPPLSAFLLSLPNLKDLSVRSRILLVAHRILQTGSTNFTSVELTDAFADSGLPPPDHVERRLSILSRGKTAPLVKYGPGAYALSVFGQKELQDYLGTTQTAASGQSALTALVGRISGDAEQRFLAEAIACVEVKARRAAVVMVWAMTVDHLERYVLSQKLAEFNSTWAKRADNKGRSIATQDDFLEIRDEKTFIEILRSATIITNDVRKILDEKLGFRNTCAHPNDIVIPESKVLAAVEDLVYNVVLKYPL
jgi:hypothetical protein